MKTQFLILTSFPLLGSLMMAAEKKPNILLLIADEWRGDATGYAGDPNVKTPHLDRLAKEGLNFANAVSVTPVCTPFRAALQTGRFPTSTGMFLNDAYLPAEELCMAEILHGAGYDTGYIGKWHIDGHGRDSFIPQERRQGWDYWKVLECTHDYNHSAYYSGNDPKKLYWDGYDAFAQTKDAQAYIKSRAGNPKPFILMIAFGPPHFPVNTAPEEYKKMYPVDKLKLAPNVPPSQRKRALQQLQGYYAHCTAVDRCIGDLMATLDETGLAKDTIVIFSADHGETMGSHGNNPDQKQVPWDESARVPFLLRYPAAGGPNGVTVKTPLTTPDILPTLLGLAGLPVPKSVEGDDLSKIVREPTHAEDRVALYEGISPFAKLGEDGHANNREYRAIRTSSHTYVRDLNGPWLLYDDRKDSYQMDNLLGQPEHAALQKELEAKLQAQLKARGDEFRDGQYYIDLWGYKAQKGGSVPYGPGATMQSPKRQTPAK
jgi:arylsulfatase A-like enzyme